LDRYYGVIIFGVLIVAMYFMMIRPQQKQRRAQQDLLASVKKGDQVMTASGIYGTVKKVEDTVIVLEVAKGITIKMARRAIVDIIRDSAQAKAIAPESTSTARGKRNSQATDEADLVDDDVDAAELADDAGEDPSDAKSAR
jgi:preprotein translocase subunit YajC